MIRKIIPLLVLFLGNFVSAQVGIGTREPSPASVLDIVAKDKGILLPRIQLKGEQDKSAIVNPEESLLVYNTGSTSLVAGFYYWKDAKWTQLLSGANYTDTKNRTFTIEKDSNDIESLVITDTQGGKVFLAISAIAKNNTFVTNLVENQDFITKLGDNLEFITHITNNEDFITNIVNELKGKYGNVNYNPSTNTFVYYDEDGVEHNVDWSALNTTNVSFTLVNDKLVVTDSEQNTVELAVTDIATNKTFVENIATNQDFITKLGDNLEFITHITNNEDFITNIVNELKGKYGNVNYNPSTNTFVYYDEDGVEHNVDWSALNTTNVSFTLVNDKLVVTDSEQNTVELAVTDIATNKTFVENIATNQDFITKLGDNLEFITHITNNEDFITNIVNELKGKYGNVNYNPSTNTFVYYDEDGVEHNVDWSALNTTNVSFTLVNDKLVVTDSEQNTVELAVTDIATNKTFVENIATNQDFITKLGDNLEFITHITNNEDFITNIVNELKGKYGNVNYNPSTNTFVYYDEDGVEHNVDWSALNTTNVSFTLVNDKLVVTDSEQNTVELAVTDIAANKTFVENIATNQDFITKLGDNLEFVNHITSNEDFITNVINTLKGKYGNVNYNPTTNTFVYYDEHGVEHEVDWSVLNTTNVSFTLVNDKLVVTDLEQNVVELAVTDIAANKTFVENIATNQDFITKLGDNTTFITTIVDMLKGKYGNVGFDVSTNSFFYYDADYNVVHISWESLGNTKIKSFTIDEVNNELVVTDTEDRRFPVAIDDLGKVIANNDVFVTNLVENKKFTTKLGNDEHFVTTITNNEDFITNIVNELKGKYGNVNYDPSTNTFVYYDEHGVEHNVDWGALNTTNVSFTLVGDKLVVTDSEQNTVELAVTDIATNKTFVENIATNQDFITKLGDNLEFINHITNNEDFITNIVNELKGKYGNVNYDPSTNTFVYYDEHGVEHNVDWGALNTTNVSFTFSGDKLVVTDSEQNTVELAVTEIASNKTFVENIATNQDFITKLGDNLEFINHITNNEDFITNIVNELKGKYGNVNYDPSTNTFVYYDEHGVEHNVDWGALNTTNVSFTLVGDKLVVTDSEQNTVELAVTDIATNKTFVENIATNQDFITKLGDNLEFINHITNNEDFITNIVNELKGKYGNVNYDPSTNTFVYYDEHGVEHNVDWGALNTTNVSFTLVGDKLVVTDSEQNTVELAVTEIASNKTFVENIATNQDFITKLGDNLEFINHITNNEDFITNIVNELKGKYGNVNYDPSTNTFVYYDEHGVEHNVDWGALNTTNVSFTLVGDKLVVTDSEQNTVELAVTDIATNKTFVENIATNQDFITKLGDNTTFITTIVDMLKGKYGNVGFDEATNSFFYYDADYNVEPISWESLGNTKIKSFAIDEVNDLLVITDTEGNLFPVAIDDLGKVIANNDVFVTNLVENKKFTTKLGNDEHFVTTITNNEDFITNIVNELKGKYGNVNYDPSTNTFVYYDDHGVEHNVDWGALNTTNVSFTLVGDKLVVTDSEQNTVELAVTEIASNKTFVENIATNQDFITKLGDNLEFINHITNNEDFITNIVNELKGKYGNVNYDPSTNTFVYYDDHGVEHNVDWGALNTTNVSFTLVGDKLVVTDSEQNTVELAVTDIATNKTFVENIATNQDFITKLGDNLEFINHITNNEDFITNIVNELKGKYGNVNYDPSTNTFVYYDDHGVEHNVDWGALNTTNVSFTLVGDKLVVTDSEQNTVELAVTDIATNKTFVENIATNQDFITKLGDNTTFITTIVDKLKGKYGNVGFDADTQKMFYYDENYTVTPIEWEDIVSAAETLTALTSSNSDDKALLIYEDENKTTNEIDLVAVLQGSPLFETYLKDYISSVSIEETTTKLNRIETGLYEYLNEEAVKNGTAGVKITVTQDVIDDFETIVDNEDVLSILTTIINNTAGDVSVEKVGEDIVIKNKAGLIVNLTEEIQKKETKTWLEHVKRREVEETPSGDIEYFVHSIKYHGEDSTDQRNQEILISELIKGSETITELDYNVQTGELFYTNEVGTKTSIPLNMLVKQFESKTELIIDQDAKKLIYQGENSRKEIDLAPVIQEPWLQVATQTGATNSNQDMYVNGWVGIGYDKPSGTVNEKLRVNGSITATNSYYADYVFEKYFTGESELKYDYVFNDLNTVASFIKNNRHLPGITPISELEKADGGYSFNVSELSIQLLEKTEELYLHIIEQYNKISELEKQNEELKELEQEFEKAKQDSQRKNETLLLLVQKIEELEQTVNALKK